MEDFDLYADEEEEAEEEEGAHRTFIILVAAMGGDLPCERPFVWYN